MSPRSVSNIKADPYSRTNASIALTLSIAIDLSTRLFLRALPYGPYRVPVTE